jgi:hypothetical protein
VLRQSPATASCTNLGAKKPISCAKPAHFDFFAINFSVWSHIPSNSGDAADTWQVADVVTPIRYPPDIMGIYFYYYKKIDALIFYANLKPMDRILCG